MDRRPAPRPLRLLHVSDTHLRAGNAGRDGNDGSDLQSAPEGALGAALEVFADRPNTNPAFDLAVHTGDIADDASVAAARRAAHLLATVAPRLVGVPGNHDSPAAVRTSFGEPMVEVGVWRVIGWDTTIPGEVHGAVDADEVAAALDALDPRPTVLAVHHPLRSRSTNPLFRLDGAEQLLGALVQRPHVRLVLSGHTHEVYDEQVPGPHGTTRLFGGPSTWYGMSHAGEHFRTTPDTGVAVVTLHHDGAVQIALETARRGSFMG